MTLQLLDVAPISRHEINRWEREAREREKELEKQTKREKKKAEKAKKKAEKAKKKAEKEQKKAEKALKKAQKKQEKELKKLQKQEQEVQQQFTTSQLVDDQYPTEEPAPLMTASSFLIILAALALCISSTLFYRKKTTKQAEK